MPPHLYPEGTTPNMANPAEELLGAVLVTDVPSNLWNAARIALKIGLSGPRRGTKANKDVFKPLVDDACGLVYTLLYKDVGPTHSEGIKSLCEVLDDIQRCMEAHAFKSILSRTVNTKEIERQAHDFRERLQNLLDRFGLNSGASIQQYFTQLRRRRMAESAPHDTRASSTTPTGVPISPIAPPTLHESQERPTSQFPFTMTPPALSPGSIYIVLNLDNGITRDSGNTTTTSASNSYNESLTRFEDHSSERPSRHVPNPAVVDS